VALGIDVGGTKILGLAMDDEHREMARVLLATPHPPAPDGGVALAASIAEVATQLEAAAGTGPIGIGVPGLLRDQRHLVFGPHLRSAMGADLVALLEGTLGERQIIVRNDADLAAVAEHEAGAARGHDDVLMITLGTGIGGGIISGGRLITGASFAGEVGHMVVDAKGALCPCGSRGCWERYASGSGLGRLAREAALGGRLGVVVATCGGDPEAVRGEDVTEAAAAGDRESLELLDEVGWWLALGIANLIAILDPSVVVLGGGMASAAGLLLGPAQRHLGGLVEAAAQRGPLLMVAARFGPDAGAVGASLAARRWA
jgi:glucokinase